MKQETVAQALANSIQAMNNCEESGNTEWHDKWETRIDNIMEQSPSGSGIDCGTTISYDHIETHKPITKLVFLCSYHHMNQDGYYIRWTEHRVTVRPDWQGVSITISGRNRNDIKDYLADVYGEWLDSECTIQA